MTTGSPIAAKVFQDTIRTTKWEPFEAGEIAILHSIEGTSQMSGLWRVTPEQAPPRTEVPMHATESVYIIEGHVSVEIPGGAVLELKAGSMAAFEKGWVTYWTIHEPTLEFFVYS